MAEALATRMRVDDVPAVHTRHSNLIAVGDAHVIRASLPSRLRSLNDRTLQRILVIGLSEPRDLYAE
jgi:hypothetical protein